MAVKCGLNILIIITVILTVSVTEALSACVPDMFRCFNGKCVSKTWYCDGANDCGDNSDEMYCGKIPEDGCPFNGIRWLSCKTSERCYPFHYRCDGVKHCPDGSDETGCVNSISGVPVAWKSLTNRMLEITNSRQSDYKWSEQFLKAAVALQLAEPYYFEPGNATGELIAHGITLYLMGKKSMNLTISTEELSWFVNGLLVTCMNPKDCFGWNLVQELRARVDSSSGYVNPFTILTLCNAGDTMTEADVDKVESAFYAYHRRVWTETQAIATLALSCMAARPNLNVRSNALQNMTSLLKRQQKSNGTVNDMKTTALVVQALIATGSQQSGFDLSGAAKYLAQGLSNIKTDDAYYILPVFNTMSFANISSHLCEDSERKDLDMLKYMRKMEDKYVYTNYSLAVGDDMNFIQSWRMRVPENFTFYQLLEKIGQKNPEYKPEYSVYEGKPYVKRISEYVDNVVSGTFWFIYMLEPDSGPIVTKQSPVDIQVKENVELILWYKTETWEANLKALLMRKRT